MPDLLAVFGIDNSTLDVVVKLLVLFVVLIWLALVYYTWADALVLTRPSNPRALPAADLAAVAERVLPAHELHVDADAHDGLARARRLAGARGTVLATGSLHLVADLRRGRGAAPGARF